MKKFALALAVLAIFGMTLTSYLYANKEGKKHKEIDLPIERPKPKDIPEEEEDGDDPTFYGEEIDSETDSMVYVIDESCSMYGSRIAKAKAELVKSVQALTKNFKFSIVAYSCNVRVWQNKLVEATAQNKSAAVGWSASIQPTGATNTSGGVARALQIDTKNKLVVLLTDGAPNCMSASGYGSGSSSSHLSKIISSNAQKAKIDVFAIQPWSGSYKKFCQDIAQKSGGKYREVN